MHTPKSLGATSPVHIKTRTASPYQTVATWNLPGTGSTSGKPRSKTSGGEVSAGGEGTLWKRALSVTGVGVATEGVSPNHSAQTTQTLYNVVMKATQAQKGADKANSSLNKSAKQYGTKEEMYLELQGLKKAVRLAGNERDNLKSRLRRTEEELNRRDKELEEVLSGNGGLSQQELVRSLGDKDRTGQGQGSGGKQLILSLKRQIYSLQKTLREREHALTKLQEDSRIMDTRELQVQLDVCTQEILRLTSIIDNYEKEASEHYQKQLKLLHAKIREVQCEKTQVEDEKRELVDRLKELDPFVPPKDINMFEGNKKIVAKRYLGMSYMLLLENLASLEVDLIVGKKREEAARSKFTQQLEGKEVMLLEMIDKESSLQEEISGLERESETLSQRYKNLTQECENVVQEKEHVKLQMHDRDGELDDMRGKAVEAERERNNLSSEIDNLNDWRRNELLAHEHARKLLQTGSNPFIRSDSKHRREKGARTIQRYWSMHRTKKRQNSFVSDYNWAVDVVQDGFDKYQTDREVISNPKPTQPSVANEIEPIHTADVYTQTEELVLINLLQELKDREELAWAVDTIQQEFESYSQNRLILDKKEIPGTELEDVQSYMTAEQAMKMYKQNEPEN